MSEWADDRLLLASESDLLTREIATEAMHTYTQEASRIKLRVQKLGGIHPSRWGWECGPALTIAEIAPDQAPPVKADALAPLFVASGVPGRRRPS